MNLVIDSGSTKADWRLIKSETIENLETLGLSPVLHSQAFIDQTIKGIFEENSSIPESINHIYYYGTGCWDKTRKGIIKSGFEKTFPEAAIEVENDLLGAARATCGNKPGIVAIMGTGSNSCLYDGRDITGQVENLGYLLGDEGSGGDLGKALLQAYFYKELPPPLLQALDPFFPEGKTTLLNNLYKTERPNAYLASFTKFIAEHKEYPIIQQLIETSFANFFDRHLRKYNKHQQWPIHFVGSIAYYFRDFIQKLLEERQMRLGLIIKKPIDYLVKFHSSNE